MATKRKLDLNNITLDADEVLGMEFYSGYKRYFVIGKDTRKMFREIISMYNSYAGTKHTVTTFRKFCKEQDMSCYLYMFNINDLISFDDDCYSMGERNGLAIDRYI